MAISTKGVLKIFVNTKMSIKRLNRGMQIVFREVP